MTTLNNICVYCGSNVGSKSVYRDSATEFGHSLAQNGIGLVYGGGNIGLMGVIADAVLEAGGQVVGVIPEALAEIELAHGELTELVVTQSMHERKKEMADRADAFVAMPGGIGTFEELFEVWTWGQLGFHNKPCGVFNVAGYYDAMIGFLDHAVEQQFLKMEHRSMLVVENEANALLSRLSAYGGTTDGKWITHSKTS